MAPRLENVFLVEAEGLSSERSSLTSGDDVTQPDYWRCKSCGCLWRDNKNGSVTPAGPKQSACDRCSKGETEIECEPLWLSSALVAAEAPKQAQPATTLAAAFSVFSDEYKDRVFQSSDDFARSAFYAGAQTFCSAMNEALDDEGTEEDNGRRIDALLSELSAAVEELKL